MGLRGTFGFGIEGAAGTLGPPGWGFGSARDGPLGRADIPLDPMTVAAACTTVQPGPGCGTGTGVTVFGRLGTGLAERELASTPGAVAGTALAVGPGIGGRGTGVILAGGLLAPSGLGLRETPVSRIRNAVTGPGPGLRVSAESFARSWGGLEPVRDRDVELVRSGWRSSFVRWGFWP